VVPPPLKGATANHAKIRYPPNTEEKQKDLGEWFGKNMPQGPAAALPGYIAALKAANPSITSWGLIGVSSLFLTLCQLLNTDLNSTAGEVKLLKL
jgi:hypothetical protein